MNLISTLTGAVSKVTGLSVRTKVEIALVAALALALFLGWKWVDGLRTSNAAQAAQITTLNEKKATLEQEKIQLKTDVATAQAQRDDYAKRTEALNQESIANDKKAQKYKADSESARKALAELLAADDCARHSVPDSVIRMQQQAIKDFNARYPG